MTTMPEGPNATEQRLREIIARVARVAPDGFSADDDLRLVLGLDSLSALRIAAAVERDFGLTIPDAELQDVRSLADLSRRATAGASVSPFIPI
jgi:acyl carrier protein